MDKSRKHFAKRIAPQVVLFLFVLAACVKQPDASSMAQKNENSVIYQKSCSGNRASLLLRQDGKVFSLSLMSSGSNIISKSGLSEIVFPEKICDIGMSATCAFALGENGSLWLWGSNQNGQLCQTNLNFQTATPQKIPIDMPIVHAAVSDTVCIAVAEDGSCYGWGNNRMEAISDQRTLPKDLCIKPYLLSLDTGPDNIPLAVSAGEGSVSFLTQSGDFLRAGLTLPFEAVWAPPYEVSYSYPIPFDVDVFPSPVVCHSIGVLFDLYLLEDGSVYVNGLNTEGELCLGTDDICCIPQPLPLHFPIQSVSVYGTGALLLSTDGHLYGMGRLGNRVYAQVTRLNEDLWTCASLGKTHGTLLDQDGNPWLFQNPSDIKTDPVCIPMEQADNLMLPAPAKPAPVFESSAVAVLSCGNDCIVAVMQDGALFSWGTHNYGWPQGTGKMISSEWPEPLPLDACVIDAGLGQGYGAALTDEGIVYTWGMAAGGNGTKKEYLSPHPLQLPERIDKIFPGYSVCIALGESGTIYQWGNPAGLPFLKNGQEDFALPYAINNEWGFVDFSFSPDTALALDANGEVWFWGRDWAIADLEKTTQDQLLSIPKKVDLPEKIIAISAAPTGNFAIGETGVLYGWGLNSHDIFQRGDETICFSSPEPVLPDRRFRIVSATGQTVFAVTTEEDVLRWGMQIGTYGETSPLLTVSHKKPVKKLSTSYAYGIIQYQNGDNELLSGTIKNPF